MGANPVRQSLRTSNRKRVLRGGGQLSLRGVDSETKCCVIEPRNPTCGEPPSSSYVGAMPDPLTQGPLPRIRSHRGLKAGRMVMRVPRELGIS